MRKSGHEDMNNIKNEISKFAMVLKEKAWGSYGSERKLLEGVADHLEALIDCQYIASDDLESTIRPIERRPIENANQFGIVEMSIYFILEKFPDSLSYLKKEILSKVSKAILYERQLYELDSSKKVKAEEALGRFMKNSGKIDALLQELEELKKCVINDDQEQKAKLDGLYGRTDISAEERNKRILKATYLQGDNTGQFDILSRYIYFLASVAEKFHSLALSPDNSSLREEVIEKILKIQQKEYDIIGFLNQVKASRYNTSSAALLSYITKVNELSCDIFNLHEVKNTYLKKGLKDEHVNAVKHRFLSGNGRFARDEEGNKLKNEILEGFKEKIEDVSSLDDLKILKQNIKKDPLFTILSTPQDRFTAVCKDLAKFFNINYRTSSEVALDYMFAQQENYLKKSAGHSPS